MTGEEFSALPAAIQRVDAPVIALHGLNGATIGRSLPHSIEAEEYLLSSCLLDGASTIDKCHAARITPESFYDTKHGMIFRRLLRMAEEGKPLETYVLAEELKAARELDSVGGMAFLTQMSSRLGTTAETPYFINRVREFAVLRDVIRGATSAVEDAYNFSGGIEEFTALARQRLESAMPPAAAKDTDWPPVISAQELSLHPPPTPPVLIDGILYVGGTMLISGPSKAHKTFSALDAGIAIAQGGTWLGHQCAKSTVLYLNLELQGFATEERIRKICSARGHAPPPNLHLWNLRGRDVTLLSLTAKLPAMIAKLGASVVCIDPHYKISSVSGMEENSNDDQGKLLTLLEGLCVRAGAGLINTHHFAKGDASNKNAIDRASGGGVFARWGDVMLTFTPHEEEDAMTVEMSLRNFAPVTPFVVRWEYPRWIRDSALNPSDLRTSRGRKEENTPQDALRALTGMMGFAEWHKATGMSHSTFNRKRAELIDTNLVEVVGNCYRKK